MISAANIDLTIILTLEDFHVSDQDVISSSTRKKKQLILLDYPNWKINKACICIHPYIYSICFILRDNLSICDHWAKLRNSKMHNREFHVSKWIEILNKTPQLCSFMQNNCTIFLMLMISIHFNTFNNLG